MTKRVYDQQIIEPQDFNKAILKLREFFIQEGYVETFPQSRLSILAACEDPKTVRSFNFDKSVYPLPQTGQMWLERDLMINADKLDGVYCLTASYRDEPNPIHGRHLKSFPMFEVEHKGNFKHLIDTVSRCCVHLELVENVEDIPIFTYDELCEHYNVSELENEQEELMWKEYGDVVAIVDFPEKTSPFFNMKQEGYNKHGEKLSKKVDFIVCGQETFGCAERECDPKIMTDNFHTISEGEYAQLLFDSFGKERVEQELEDFVNLPMIERWGFGMGFTRLLRAMKIKNLL